MGGKGILLQPERTGALSTLNNQSVCFQAQTERRRQISGGGAAEQAPTINTDQNYAVACDVYNQTIEKDTAPTVTAAVGGANTRGPKVMACDLRNGREQETNGTLQAKPGGA